MIGIIHFVVCVILLFVMLSETIFQKSHKEKVFSVKSVENSHITA